MTKRQTMRTQSPKKRINNFCEVALGFNETEAMIESSRCLDCKHAPCVAACPVHINIPAFIKATHQGQFKSAYERLFIDNMLPSICGRVCPQESQCEGACVLGIKSEPVAIGALERFIGDLGSDFDTSIQISENHHSVAVVGSGPAGLSNAFSMRKLGYSVTVYEALHDFGGVLQYGIPDFRLPKPIVKREIEQLKALGITFEKNVIIGKTITIKQLFNDEQFDAIFIGSGAGLPRRLNIEGENNLGVSYANEFLTRVNLMKANQYPKYKTPVYLGNKVAVIGGGNVAMDAARTAKRLGAKDVFILYRRGMDGLPARKEEIEHAKEEGICFKVLRNPVAFLGSNYVTHQVKCEIMTLGEVDASGRRRPVGTNAYETIDVDHVIVAIGQSPNPILKRTTSDLEVDEYGRIVTQDYQTSLKGVFAGGDVVSGAATVILAMGAGKDAARAMHDHITSKTS